MTERLPNTDETAWNLILDPWLLLEHNTDGTHKFSGTPTGSKFLRDDRVWAAPPGAAGSVFFNVVDYGAVGTADDSTTMGDALTAAAGQTLVFPPGTYIHQNVTVPANTTVVLMRGAILKLKASAGSHGLLFSNAGASLIGPGTLDGNRANQSGNVMPVYITTSNITLDGVTSTGSKYNGIHAQTCSHLKIKNCYVTDCVQSGIFVDASAGAVIDVDVSFNRIDRSAENATTGVGDAGIYLYADAAGGERLSRGRVVGNDVIMPTSPVYAMIGIVTRDVDLVTFADNTVSGAQIGISLDSSTGCSVGDNTIFNPSNLGIELALATGCSVEGNTVDGNGIAQYGLSVTNTGPVTNTLTANTVKGCLTSCMRLSDGNYTTVTGNTFTHAVAQNCVLVSNTLRFAFTGNTLNGGGASTRGLVIDTSSGAVTGNTFYNFVTSGVHFRAATGTLDNIAVVGNTFQTIGTVFTTDFTGGATFGDNVRLAKNAGAADMDQVASNAQTNNYSLVLSDANKVVEMNKASAVTLTVPFDSQVAYPVGTEIDIYQLGAGQVTVSLPSTSATEPSGAFSPSGTDTDAASYTTPSYTPHANRLQLLAVLNSRSGALPTIPTVTGAGLTWVQVATIPFAAVAVSQRRLTVFRALGASPTTGALTIDFAGITQNGGQWQMAEWTDVPTTGTNGSGAVIQSVTATVAADGQATSITAALSAFGSAQNRTYAAVAHAANEDTTPRASWTEIHDPLGSYGSPGQNLETQWSDAAGADTTVSATWSTSQYAAIIGIEVATFPAVIHSPSGNKKLIGQYSRATLRNRAADEWALTGDLTA